MLCCCMQSSRQNAAATVAKVALNGFASRQGRRHWASRPSRTVSLKSTELAHLALQLDNLRDECGVRQLRQRRQIELIVGLGL